MQRGYRNLHKKVYQQRETLILPVQKNVGAVGERLSIESIEPDEGEDSCESQEPLSFDLLEVLEVTDTIPSGMRKKNYTRVPD
jgi:hypothetical protein